MYSVFLSDVKCMTDKDDILPDDTCQSQLGPAPSSTQLCHVACDQEVCTLSDWSEWGQCTKRCSGVQMRTRTMEGGVTTLLLL